MKLIKKLKSRAGFTLAETLLAIMILLMVSVIVVTGMPVARSVYEKVVLSSNAETLLTTAASSLRNELGTAWKVRSIFEGSIPKGVTYFSAATGTRAELSIEGGTIQVKDYAEATKEDLLGINANKSAETPRVLVFPGQDKILDQLALKADKIVLDVSAKTVTIYGLRVEGASGTLAGSDSDTLTIPVFSTETAQLKVS